MMKLTAGTVLLLSWAGICLAYGYIYETSYFLTLGLSAGSTLGIKHYIYSGFSSTVIPLLLLVALSLLVKFFSKHVARNDAQAFVAAAKEIGFAQSLNVARMVFLFCLGIWLLAIFENHLFDIPRAAFGIPWLLFFTLQAFAFAMYTSPPASRVPVLFAFSMAIGLCTSAWAIGAARFAQSPVLATAKYIRDDGVVRVVRSGSTYTAEAKALKLPLPLLEKMAGIISGESN